MDINKNRSTIRIALSSAALALFVIYAFFNNLVVNNYMSYHTYGWRMSVLNDIILLLPMIALFVFSLCERKLRHVNGRIYIIGVFLLYFVQFLTVEFLGDSFNFSYFFNDVLGRWRLIVTIVIGVRVFMLLVIPIANRVALKVYSIGMILLFVFNFAGALYVIKHIGLAAIGYCIELTLDIIFHLALYNFSDLMTKENEFSVWMSMLSFLTSPIFGRLSDDENDDGSDFDENNSESDFNTNLSLEYEKIIVYAFYTENKDFPELKCLFDRLANGIFVNSDGEYYSNEFLKENLFALKELVISINEKISGYISEAFIAIIDTLLAAKEQSTFKLDVITVVKIINRHSLSTWASASAKLDEHINGDH